MKKIGKRKLKAQCKEQGIELIWLHATVNGKLALRLDGELFTFKEAVEKVFGYGTLAYSY